jgi:hypothetical protein
MEGYYFSRDLYNSPLYDNTASCCCVIVNVYQLPSAQVALQDEGRIFRLMLYYCCVSNVQFSSVFTLLFVKLLQLLI